MNSITTIQSPILFSTPMVQAILEGRKTMTRRTIKADLSMYQKGDIIERHNSWGWILKRPFVNEHGILLYEVMTSFKCPYGKISDIIWIRETHWKGCIWDGEGEMPDHKYYYRADSNDFGDYPPKWKPSIFMPREACRLFLQITDIRVERLQDISEEDAISEGIMKRGPLGFSATGLDQNPTAVDAFKFLWEQTNGSGSWEENKWCWVISFERIEKPQ